MVAFSQFKSWVSWIEEVKRLAGDNFDYYNDWYSFLTAFDEGKSPQEAYTDCKEWMEA